MNLLKGQDFFCQLGALGLSTDAIAAEPGLHPGQVLYRLWLASSPTLTGFKPLESASDHFRFDKGVSRFHIASMVAVNSTMLPLGTRAPDFRLPDTDGKPIGLGAVAGSRGMVIAFLCNHCPYVKHVLPAFLQLARDYLPRGIGFAGISSNDAVSYPSDHPATMAELAQSERFPFPYLYDESQAVAKAYRAACTPDFYLFDPEQRLVYRGQLDDSRPGNGLPVTGKDLRAALEALLSGQPVPADQQPSIGCNIKWKPGNEPDYFL